jgi:hypothetical protein
MEKPSKKASAVEGNNVRLKDYEPTELCNECLFVSLCQGVNLPHCEGLDYVRDRGKQIH